MPKRYCHLTFEERCQVEIPKKSGLSRGSIAQHPALISVRTVPLLGWGNVSHFRLESAHLIRSESTEKSISVNTSETKH